MCRRMRHLKPREIQGCQLALDASIPGSLYDATSGGSLVAANGAVARWEDQSGNTRHVTQATSARRPARRVSGYNGTDALEMSSDAASHMATASFYPSSAAGDFTVVSLVDAKNALSLSWAYGEVAAGKLATWYPRYSSSGQSAVDFVSARWIGRSGTLPENTAAVHAFRSSASTTIADTDQRVNAIAVVENYTSNPTTALNIGTGVPFQVGGAVVDQRCDYMMMYATYNRALDPLVSNRLSVAAMRKWRING